MQIQGLFKASSQIQGLFNSFDRMTMMITLSVKSSQVMHSLGILRKHSGSINLHEGELLQDLHAVWGHKPYLEQTNKQTNKYTAC